MKKFYLLILLIALTGCSSNEVIDPGYTSLVDNPQQAEVDLLERGKSAYEDGLYSIAREAWGGIANGYPGSIYLPFIQLKIADTFYETGNFQEALTKYEEFLKEFPGNESAPYAQFRIAMCHYRQYKDASHDQTPLFSAIKQFNSLLSKFPDSIEAVEAKRLIARAREKLALHEIYVARFYIQQELLEPSVHRYQQLQKYYPDTIAAQLALDEIFSECEELKSTFEETLLQGTSNEPRDSSETPLPLPNRPLLVEVTLPSS